MKRKNKGVDSIPTVFYTEDVVIHFDGDNAIDVNTLTSYISGINTAYRALVSAEYHNPTAKMQIVAVNKGSFELVLQTIVGLAPDLITKTPTAISAFKTLMEIIKLKRELKGGKPKEQTNDGEKTKIVNQDGDVSYHDCHVVNVYMNNPIIDKGFTEAFSAMCFDPARTAVRMTSGPSSVSVEKDSFNDMASQIIEEHEATDYVQIDRIEMFLKIRKLDFVGDTKWSFIYGGGKTLTAEIEDTQFLKRIREGSAQVSANTMLKARVRIETVFDKFKDLKSRSYFIEQALGEEPPVHKQIPMAITDGE